MILKCTLKESGDQFAMKPALAPMGWTLFSLATPPSSGDILGFVNRAVNHAIDPSQAKAQVTDPWRIAPKVGWCHDYAVTKRWLLLALGFAESDLLLCECIAPDGEHHLVLRVGDVVLDNLTDRIGAMRYPVVRQQSATNPDLWEAADGQTTQV